jgi:hypothetical protein
LPTIKEDTVRFSRLQLAVTLAALFIFALPLSAHAATASITGLSSPTHPIGQWVSGTSPSFEWGAAVNWRPTLLSTTDTPGSATGVAVSGTTAYVADGTAGLQIIDISNPAAPVLRGTCDTPGSAYGVAVSGSTAYVADDVAGLQVVDVTNPAVPILKGAYDTPGNAVAVAVSGATAYVADAASGLMIIDVSNPAAPVLKGAYDTPGFAFGVAVSGTTAYVGDDSYGLRIIDVSNPAAPVLKGTCDTPGSAKGVAISGTTAYVADLSSGLAVIDVSNQSAPILRGTCAVPGMTFGVAVSGTAAYVANWGLGGLTIIDVANPATPYIRDSYNTLDVTVGVAVSGTTAYVAASAAGLQIVEVSAPAAPVLKGAYDTPGYAFGVAVAGTTAYVADGASGLQIIDVANREAPVLKGACDTPGVAFSVALRGSMAYVADDAAGLQIIDVSNPSAPILRGAYDTPGQARGVAISGTTAYVADDESGLHIIDVSNPAAPVLMATLDTPGRCFGVALCGTTAYVTDQYFGLRIIDVTNPSAPVLLGTCDTPGWAYGVAVFGTTAYVADDDAGLQVIDVSNPTAPVLKGAADTPGFAVGVAVSGTNVYVADSDRGMHIIDASNPTAPVVKRTCSTPTYAMSVAVSGATVYMTDFTAGLQVIDSGLPIVYSYVLDGSPSTVPDGIAEGSETATAFAGVADGYWYLHVRPVLAGTAAATSRVLIKVDSTAPTLTVSATPSLVTLAATDGFSGVSGIWYRVDGGAPQVYAGLPFSPGPSGRHTITAWTSDRAGNVGAKTAEVTVDSDAPVVSDDAPSGWRSGDVTVTLTASDSYSGIAALDWAFSGASAGAGSSASSPAKVAVTAEGTTTIEYSAIDTAGNRCTSETATVRIDKTAPTTTATHALGWSQSSVTVTLTPTDGVSGVASTWYRLSGGATLPYSGPFAVSEPGTTTVTFWSVDRAGVIESEKTTVVRVDGAAPVVSDDAPSGWRSGDVTVTLTAGDSYSGIAALDWALSGASAGAGSSAGSPAKVAVTAEGTTTIEYSAIDIAGNRCASETATVRIDKTAPHTTASHVPGAPGASVLVTLTPTDGGSGVASTWFRIGAGPASIYGGAFSVSTVGTTTVSFWSVDTAGNAEDPHSTAVHIDAPIVPDTTPPSITDDAPDAWRAAPVAVRLRATDASSAVDRIEWLVTGPSGSSVSGRLAGSMCTVTVSEQGTSTLAYCATDAAGNRSATETAQVRIDLTTPIMTIADSSTVSYLARLRLAGSDALSGISAIGWRIGQEPTATLPVSEALVTYEVPGPHTITAWAIDAAGNRCAAVVHTFTVTGPAWVELSTVSRTLSAWGDRFVLEGRLNAEAGPLAGARVVAQASSDGVTFSDCSAPVTTTADGVFSIGVTPETRTIYRVRSLPGEGVPGVVGPGTWALPRAFVGTPIAPAKAKVGKSFAVRGTLKSRHKVGSKPVRIYLWHFERGRWKAYGYKNATCANRATYSKYSMSLRLPKSGRWRMRAYHADSGHAASWSKRCDYVKVK